MRYQHFFNRDFRSMNLLSGDEYDQYVWVCTRRVPPRSPLLIQLYTSKF